MAVYNFSFPATAAGLTAVIRDLSGTTVASDTVPQPTETWSACVVTADLPVGWYAARAEDPGTYRDFRAPGELDVPATVGGDGEGGASAIGPSAWFNLTHTDVIDAAPARLTFVEVDDDRTPPQPDLMVVDGGDSTLLNVVEGGLYRVDLHVRPRQTGDGSQVSTPGWAVADCMVDVNAGGNGPAYNLHARSLVYLTDTPGASAAGVSDAKLGFVQPLTVADTVAVTCSTTFVDAVGTDVPWSLLQSWVTFTRLGDVPDGVIV